MNEKLINLPTPMFRASMEAFNIPAHRWAEVAPRIFMCPTKDLMFLDPHGIYTKARTPKEVFNRISATAVILTGGISLPVNESRYFNRQPAVTLKARVEEGYYTMTGRKVSWIATAPTLDGHDAYLMITEDGVLQSTGSVDVSPVAHIYSAGQSAFIYSFDRIAIPDPDDSENWLLAILS
jgi:hypothetical protein